MWREFFRMYLARCLVLVALVALAVFPSQRLSRGIAAQAAESHSCDEVYKQLQETVHQFYPRAKVVRTGDALHFEFKVKQESGFYADAGQGMQPQEGGILGDLTIAPGEYSGDRKLGVVPEGWHSTLTLAPYSKDEKTHLLAVLVFPADMAEDFQTRFRTIVSSYGKQTEQVQAQPVKTAIPERAAAAASTTNKTEMPGTAASVSKNHASFRSPWSSFLGTAGDGAPPSLPAEPIELASYRYLPAYPGKVKILTAKQATVNNVGGHRTHVVDVNFVTKDPCDEVVQTWVKRLGNENWRLAPNQPSGSIHGYVNFHVTDEAINSSGKWSSRSATLHDADVTIVCAQGAGGTHVKIQYCEPEQ